MQAKYIGSASADSHHLQNEMHSEHENRMWLTYIYDQRVKYAYDLDRYLKRVESDTVRQFIDEDWQFNYVSKEWTNNKTKTVLRNCPAASPLSKVIDYNRDKMIPLREQTEDEMKSLTLAQDAIGSVLLRSNLRTRAELLGRIKADRIDILSTSCEFKQ